MQQNACLPRAESHFIRREGNARDSTISPNKTGSASVLMPQYVSFEIFPTFVLSGRFLTGRILNLLSEQVTEQGDAYMSRDSHDTII